MSVAAEPASASEIETAIVVSPRATGGRKRSFCSSVPNRSTTRAGPVEPSNVGHAASAEPLASSSITSSASISGRPEPPYCSGSVIPIRSRSASRRRSSSGSGVRSRSHS